MTISSWLNFGRPAHRGRGSAAGWKFLARPYYSQHAVSASPLSTFFIITRFFTEQVNDDDDDDDSDDNQATSTVNDQASLSALYLWPYGTVLKCRSLKTAASPGLKMLSAGWYLPGGHVLVTAYCLFVRMCYGHSTLSLSPTLPTNTTLGPEGRLRGRAVVHARSRRLPTVRTAVRSWYGMV